MKRFVMVWIVLMVLLSTALVSVQAATFSVFVSCIEKPSASGSVRVWFGYSAVGTINGTPDFGPLDGAGFIGSPPNTLQPGIHNRVLAAEIQTEGTTVFYEFQSDDGIGASIFATAATKAPACGTVYQTSAPSIAVSLTTDCAYVEIQDAYGHWSRVTDAAHPDGILLHYDEALIGGQDQSTDPADYRAVPTACY